MAKRITEKAQQLSSLEDEGRLLFRLPSFDFIVQVFLFFFFYFFVLFLFFFLLYSSLLFFYSSLLFLSFLFSLFFSLIFLFCETDKKKILQSQQYHTSFRLRQSALLPYLGTVRLTFHSLCFYSSLPEVIFFFFLFFSSFWGGGNFFFNFFLSFSSFRSLNQFVTNPLKRSNSKSQQFSFNLKKKEKYPFH